METAFKNLHVQPQVDVDVNFYLNCQPSLMGAILRGVLCQGLKYSLPGEELHINIDSLSNGGVQVKVEAIGDSVSQQQLDRLFMSSNTTSLPPERRFLGIGLEPSIIRELIQSEGGEFSIEPLEMGGIRFRVIFPEG
jgi:K+-sensing histidine kinase KdpD